MSQTNYSKINDVVQQIKTGLERIKTADGYSCDANVKEGWARHFFSNPSVTRFPDQHRFPVVLFRPETADPKPAARGVSNAAITDDVVFAIDAAIKVSDTATPVTDLINLCKDVRRALVFPRAGTSMKTLDIEFLGCAFDVPETQDDFAFFTQKVRVNVSDRYD